MADLDRAIALEPTRASDFNLRAALRADAGQYDAALSDFDRAIELEPGAYWSLIGRCNAKTELGQPREGLADCERALEIEARAYWAYNNTAWTLYRIGLLRQALNDIEVALPVGPGQWAFLDTRGHVHVALGEAGAPMTDFLAAMAAGGAPVVALYQKALRERGLYAGEADGAVSEATKLALKTCVLQGCPLLAEPGVLPERAEDDDGGLFDPVYLCLAEHGLAEDATFLASAARSVLIGSGGASLTLVDARRSDRLVIARDERRLFDPRLRAAAMAALEACFQGDR